MAKQIFRKVALERLSSPEQLDQLITITTPMGWLALLAIGGLLLAAIFWGIYGSIPTKVQGEGILLGKGGIVSIQAQNPGTITVLNIEVDDVVKKGDIIARLRQDDILEQIRRAQLELKNLETAFQEKNKSREEALSIQLRQLKQEQVNQNQNIKNLEIQLQAQKELKQQKEEFVEGTKKLAQEGIISKNKVLEAENEVVLVEQGISSLELEIEKAKNQLNTILLEIKQQGSTTLLETLDQEQKIEALQLQIRTLQNDFAENSQIISPYTGKVTEITVTPGTLVSPGRTILLMEQYAGGQELEAVLYFSPFTGKQIKKDMKVQLSPSIVKREEYGFMEGIVVQVDSFPSTLQTVFKTLQNESLAQLLTQNAPPIKVVAELIPDPTTVSGYQWSSRKGPPIEISSGTICSVEVTVSEKAPITLVLPILKKYLLGTGGKESS